MIGSFQGNFHWKVITMTCKMIYIYTPLHVTCNKEGIIIAHVEIKKTR